MPFPYMPNEADVATYPRQAVPMSADLDNFLSHISGYAVVEGLAVTAGTGLSVSMAAGTQLRAGRFAAIAAAANQALSTADATNPRIDAIVITTAGTLTIRAGTAAALPVAPTLTTNDVLLALVTVPAAATTLTSTNIRDKRLIMEPNGIVYLNNPTANTTTTTTNTVVAAGLTIPANYLAAGQHFRVRAQGVYTSPATAGNLTVRCLYGATVLATTGAQALTASQTAKGILVELDISVISATALEVQGALDINTGAATSARWDMGSAIATRNVANIAVTSTAAQALTLDFTLSVAQTAFRWRTMTIELF
jgi:hypothetical protein